MENDSEVDTVYSLMVEMEDKGTDGDTQHTNHTLLTHADDMRPQRQDDAHDLQSIIQQIQTFSSGPQ